MRHAFLRIYRVAAPIVGLLLGLPAHAGGLLNAAGELQNAGRPSFGEATVGRGPEQLAERVGRIIDIFLAVIGTIFFILLLYGGYNWMMARGDAEKVKKAKELIIDAVIGLIIVLAAYAISIFVVSRVTQATLE